MPIDYSKYPANWKDEIRPGVLKRANYKCEVCGVGQRWKGYRDRVGDFVHCDEFMLKWAKKHNTKIITIYLAVAHLDHDVENNEDSNLRAMCQQCHNRYDAEFRKVNRLKSKSET